MNYIISIIVRRCVIVICILIVSLIPASANESQSHVIQFADFSYNPSQLEIAVGDTVVWTGSFASHPLQSSSIPAGAQSWGPISSGTEYRYVVEVEGTYSYHCTLHPEMTGSFSATITSVDESGKNVPDEIRLKQNYPNPFNPMTEIRFALPERSDVALHVYTVHGQRIATLIDGVRDAGFHTVTFDARGLPSGVYFYRLQAHESVRTMRMVYIR